MAIDYSASIVGFSEENIWEAAQSSKFEWARR